MFNCSNFKNWKTESVLILKYNINLEGLQFQFNQNEENNRKEFKIKNCLVFEAFKILGAHNFALFSNIQKVIQFKKFSNMKTQKFKHFKISAALKIFRHFNFYFSKFKQIEIQNFPDFKIL